MRRQSWIIVLSLAGAMALAVACLAIWRGGGSLELLPSEKVKTGVDYGASPIVRFLDGRRYVVFNSQISTVAPALMTKSQGVVKRLSPVGFPPSENVAFAYLGLESKYLLITGGRGVTTRQMATQFSLIDTDTWQPRVVTKKLAGYHPIGLCDEGLLFTIGASRKCAVWDPGTPEVGPKPRPGLEADSNDLIWERGEKRYHFDGRVSLVLADGPTITRPALINMATKLHPETDPRYYDVGPAPDLSGAAIVMFDWLPPTPYQQFTHRVFRTPIPRQRVMRVYLYSPLQANLLEVAMVRVEKEWPKYYARFAGPRALQIRVGDSYYLRELREEHLSFLAGDTYGH